MNYDLVPNNSGLPSMFTNDSALMMGLGLTPPGGLGEVDELTATSPIGSGTQLTPQGPNNDLASLRSRFPFLPIMPLPPSAASIILDTIGTAKDIIIPDAMVLGVFCVYGGPAFGSRNGNAEVPSLTNTGNSVQDSVQAKSFLIPQYSPMAFYVGGVKSISFVSNAAGVIISAMFYAPDQYPR